MKAARFSRYCREPKVFVLYFGVKCLFQLPVLYTCCVGVNLHKQGVFTQAATQEEGSDVMSCFFHGLQNVKCTELTPERKTQGESGYK